jgi:hypothetical protein
MSNAFADPPFARSFTISAHHLPPFFLSSSFLFVPTVLTDRDRRRSGTSSKRPLCASSTLLPTFPSPSSDRLPPHRGPPSPAPSCNLLAARTSHVHHHPLLSFSLLTTPSYTARHPPAPKRAASSFIFPFDPLSSHSSFFGLSNSNKRYRMRFNPPNFV